MILISDAGLNGEVSNDDHSISSDVPPDLTHDADSVDSEREALNLVSTSLGGELSHVSGLY
jgi:hypothetical protein